MTLLYRPLVARLVASIAIAYLLFYLWWRVSASLNPVALAFSIVFLAAEAYGVVRFLLFVFASWNVERSARFELAPDLSIDVYVPTVDEDLETLEATLMGCGAMTYPHSTYVLDDGQRPTVARLADRLGCHYLTRSNHDGYRAGNLNAALSATRGDLIAVLDADTVPQPDFLDRTVGYFVDERVALVQLPQEYYNLDSVQHEGQSHGLKPWHDLALFDRVVQPGKNHWNAATWCGSPAVIRRSAIEAIGGFATSTSVEDIQTSVRLHRQGWKTVFHNETLAYGIASQTLQAFTIQRERWARGAMELLRSADDPLLVSGLSPGQRLSYAATLWSSFGAFPRLILLLVPVIILATGVFPLRVDALTYLLHWLPGFALCLLASTGLGRGHFDFLRLEKYEYLKLFALLRASTSLIGPPRVRPRVVVKTVGNEIAAEERRLVLPLLGLAALEAMAYLLGMLNVVTRAPGYSMPTDDALLAMAWVLLNAAFLGIAVAVAFRRSYRRERYRFPIDLDATVNVVGEPVTATVRDLSLFGVGLTTGEADTLAVGRVCSVVLELPGGPVTVRGDVVSCLPLAKRRWRLGIQFIVFSPEDRARLIAFLFIIAPRLQRSRSGQPFGRRFDWRSIRATAARSASGRVAVVDAPGARTAREA